MPILRAGQAAGRKRDPFAALDAGADNPLFKRYSAENRALLRIARGDIDDGLAGIRAVSGVDQSGIDTRINAARLLAGSGHVAQAHALLAGNDPEVAAVAAGLGKGTRSEGHKYDLPYLIPISYSVFCLQKTKRHN